MGIKKILFGFLFFCSIVHSQTCADFPEITASTTNLCNGLSATLSVNYTPPTICNMNITPSTIPLGNPIPGFTYAGIFNGHYYYVYNTPTSWTQGELICRQNGGYLVCINDINENAFVSNSTNSNIWIGMFRDPVTCNFRWLDCMNITFTNWRPGEPNSGPCGEPYVQIIRGCSFGLNTWNNLSDVSSNGACYSNMVPIMEIDPALYNIPINPTTTYLWSTGETTSSITVAPTSTTNYWVDITTGTLTCRKNITINVGPSISPAANPNQTFCGSATIADLSAIGTNIKWYASSTGGTPLVPTTTLVNGGSYYATQTITGCESQIRTLVNVSILPQTISPSGNSTQSFCNTALVSDLVATGTNIQWYSSITGGTALNTNTALINGTTYYASQTTNSCESTTRLAVTVNINNPQISATSNTICLGESSTLTASNTNNSTSNSCTMPSNLQNGLVGYWPFCGNANDESGNGNNGTVNGAALTTDRFGNANNAYTFDGNDFIETNRVNLNSFTVNLWLNLTSFNCFSALIDAYPSSWEFLTDCNTGTNLSSAIWNNTATYQIYQSNYIVPINTWTQVAMTYENNVLKIYANGIIAISTVSIAPPNVNGFYYFGRSRSGTDQFLDGKLDDIAIWNRALTQQEIQQLYNQSITTYLWSTGETTATITVTPSTTTNYWVDVNSNGVTCRKNITITVNSSTPAPTAPSPQTFCNSATVADLIANGNNIKWYSSATGGSPLLNSTVLVNGTTYYASQTLNGCESIIRLPVNVIINTPAGPTGNSIQLFCNSATVANLLMNGQNIQWYTSATGGTPLTSTTTLTNGTTYFASQTINGCENLVRTPVIVTIDVVSTPVGGAIQEFCKIDTPRVSNLTPNSSNIKWYTAPVGVNPLNQNTLLLDGTTYYAESTNLTTGCKSRTRLEVLVKINDSNPPVGETNQVFCAEDIPTLSNVTMDAENALVWYDNNTGGNILPLTTLLEDNQIYYASNLDNLTGCYSSVRTKVDIKILQCELEINNILTLNDNNLNEFIFIKNIDNFPKSEFQIFNRYGKLVWRGYNYNNIQNTFTGKANVQGVYKQEEYLPTGTYFYVLTYFDRYRNENKEVKGFLQINNNQ